MDEGSFASDQNTVMTGVLAGPIRGICYQTPTSSGVTNERGEFSYLGGETVTFLIGGLVLGTTKAAPRVNLAQLVNRVAGNIEKLRDPGVTNLARLVLSLDQAGGVEGGVAIAAVVHEAVASMPINFSQPEDAFEKDAGVVGLLAKLNVTPGAFTANTPRALCDGAAARNELRRNIRGIFKQTDVRIPLRDGSCLRRCLSPCRRRPSSRHHEPKRLRQSLLPRVHLQRGTGA